MMLPSLALLALPAASLAAQQAQVYLSPRPISGSALSTSPRDANALLSAHLGIAEYESAPQQKHWSALGIPIDVEAPWEQTQPDSLIIMVEGSPDSLPDSLTRHGATLTISSPPSPDAFDALVSVYLRRFARVFGLHLAEVHGIEAFAHSAATTIEAWADWAVDGLHESWSYLEDLLHMRPDITLPVEPKPEYSRLLGELALVDQSGQTLIKELHELDGYVESLSDERNFLDSDVRYHSRPSVAALRFKGLHEVEQAHGLASAQYERASRLFKQVLEGALAAFDAKSRSSGKVIALVVPPSSSRPALLKRSAANVLAPFTSASRTVKRQESGSSKPLVPISTHCYDDEDACNKGTDSCSGHGSCVQGAVMGASGKTCYVCQCKQTEKNGRPEIWAGEACQKQDYSNQFFLLAGTVVFLLVIVVASVAILTSIGSEELPQTLSAIAAMGRDKSE